MANRIFVRRHLWMMVFGLLHAFFLWQGDFLFPYGIMALLLLSWARRLPVNGLLALGLFLAIVPSTIGIAEFHHSVYYEARSVRVATASVERQVGIAPGPDLASSEQQWKSDMHPPVVNRIALEQAAHAGQASFIERLHQPLAAFLNFEYLVALAASLDLSGMMLIGMALL